MDIQIFIGAYEWKLAKKFIQTRFSKIFPERLGEKDKIYIEGYKFFNFVGVYALGKFSENSQSFLDTLFKMVYYNENFSHNLKRW